MIPADGPRLSSTACWRTRRFQAPVTQEHPALIMRSAPSMERTNSPRSCSGSRKNKTAGKTLLAGFSNVRLLKWTKLPLVEMNKNMNPLKCRMITWVPWELLHVPEAHDEQENVAGETFLDVCKRKRTHLGLNSGATWSRGTITSATFHSARFSRKGWDKKSEICPFYCILTTGHLNAVRSTLKISLCQTKLRYSIIKMGDRMLNILPLLDIWNKLFFSNFLNTLPLISTNCDGEIRRTKKDISY